ncbi:S-adenosyl-L-methionine-dependent methyltransferase [Hyaloscypha bicolor E]|uniref:S-adenosyl-L-methionine-dependent methyltransferase n=1 Tax=Hyaloscypha bicolor E TaxID=1095630 RepID=A0A2J6SU75_9HELO|nr:S-adenosyl-L-methionine-dependent methyltransferase [Hyaloscypha bicolor E]PMD54321.1 S-adenosyl-L-methionine-dependent methyltransferase [Hyaloscypha bicolor E]
MFNDEDLIELSHPKYWDGRYRSEQRVTQNGIQPVLDSYEWFRSFEQLRPFFENNLPPSSSGCHILHLGCGNSNLTADLYALGYTNQTSIDFSQVVIDAMMTKYSDLETRWGVMDVRELQLPDGSVDVAIDKGTLDAMIHGSLWDPPADVQSNVGKYVDEVARVLKPGGQWLYITYRQPHFMKPLLERKDSWDFAVKTLGDSQGTGEFDYFGFIMKRHEASNTS